MKKIILKTIQYLFFLSIGIFLLYIAFKDIDLKKFIDQLRHANYYWVLLSFVFTLLSFWSRAYRWKMLIEPMGYNPSLKNTFYAVCIIYVGNLVFPRMGEVARCGALNKTDKIPVDKLLGTVIVERVIDVLMLVFITLLVFFIKIDFFGKFLMDTIFSPSFNWIQESYQKSVLNILLLGGGVILLFLFAFLFRKKYVNSRIFKKMKNIIKGIIDGTKTLIRMKKKGVFLFHTFFIWLMYTFMTYLVFFSLPFTSKLDFVDGLFILVFGGIGMTIPVQGGFGTFHAIVALGLSLYGITKEEGLLYATLSHESQILLCTVLGIISLIMVIKTKKRLSKT